MPITVAVLAAVLLFQSGCSLNRLRVDLDRADDSYAYIKLAPIATTAAASRVLLILYQQTDAGPQLINYDVMVAGEESFFLVPVGSYRVAAFEDINHDLSYQPGEPAAFRDDVPLSTGGAEGEEELDYEAMESLGLQLSTGVILAQDIDFSAYSPQEQLDRAARNFLQVSTWDNKAFAEENVKKGLWQPLTFHEETGYGLYLLEELNPAKTPLLLVHGINGSPVNFRTLADSLGEEYQLLLFQYPSGFPLDHTAYILHRGVVAFLERYPYERMDVLAHSMGGLVSRGMLVQNDPATNARIGKYITLATPWSGHDAARLGVKWSPTVAPVWKSMAPDSYYLQQLFAESLPSSVSHHLFFAFADGRDGKSGGSDGAVSVSSQLKYQAQRDAEAIYGIRDSHTGILSNPCVLATVAALLQSSQSPGNGPLPICEPGSP